MLRPSDGSAEPFQVLPALQPGRPLSQQPADGEQAKLSALQRAAEPVVEQRELLHLERPLLRRNHEVLMKSFPVAEHRQKLHLGDPLLRRDNGVMMKWW